MLSRVLDIIGVCSTLGCTHRGSTATHPSSNAVQTTFSKTSDVVYTPPGWPQALQADVYHPDGAGPWPGVLLIYGGSWSSADHRWQMTFLARKIARRGFIVVNAAYRGTPEFRYPAPFDDMREALRWMRSPASKLRLVPDKVGVYGFSAGGQLAALVGTMDGPPEVRVQAAVAASAPTDLTLYPTGKILPRFLGSTYRENPKIYRDASPVTYVSADDPPFFLYHGTDDKTVSPKHSENFKAALDRAGVRNEFIAVKGRAHASMLIRGGDAENAAINFLDSVLR